ncbi:Drug resistance transporter, EmrB/QacA subfamily [Hoyosella subflava DQS3-9A1]|uniref:Drug resistance transporter, EmrB/QacA subfamily n=1 Tax=Hoyosella subflava (strain DSM 45089 / JCM 17490 / NBRC 109087 / DQS3-9A1) TaxID=443218 RepID=F6EK12_HOYSD|nr:Drug resistance transporter, EmrB/QacA subfamily [Hoyosella subflava DQS3-9A1]
MLVVSHARAHHVFTRFPHPAAKTSAPMVLLACSLTAMMAGLDGTVLNVAAPQISHDVAADLSEVLWIVNGYSLAFAALLVTFGTLGDSIGHRRLFIGGVALFVFGSVLAATSDSVPMLIVARVLSGIGAAAQAPAGIAVVNAAFPVDRRPTAIGITVAAASAGLAVGPVIGGALIELFTWRAIFWVSVPVGIIAIGLGLMFVGETEKQQRESYDFTGTVLLTVALVGIIFGLIQQSQAGWQAAEVIASLVLGTVCAIAFLRHELRSSEPLLDLALFRNPAFRSPIVVGAILSFGLISVFLFISIYYQSVRGLSAIETGLLYLPTTVMIVVLAPFTGTLLKHVAPRTVVSAGLLIAAAGLAMYAGITPMTAIVWLAIAQLLIGIGVGLAFPPLSNLALDAVEKARAGLAISIMKTSREVVGTLGLAVMGILVVTFGDRSLHSAVADAGLPPSVAETLAGVKVVGDQDAVLESIPADDRNQVIQLITESAASGIGTALAIGSALIVICAIYAWRTIPGSVAEKEDA